MTPPMLLLEGLGYRYSSSDRWAILDIDARFKPGEAVALVGESGSGKSSILRSLNGLIPHFYGGLMTGRVLCGGIDTRIGSTAHLSSVVGYLNQEPEAQTILDRVRQEIAFGPANQLLTRREIDERVEEALGVMDIERLREREISTLSGGERQRVQIAATLAMRPQFLALDEPFSQVDPWSARRLADWLGQAGRNLGVGIIIAEHRTSRILPVVSSVVQLDRSGRISLAGNTRDVTPRLDHPPPLVRLATALGWPETPLSAGEALELLESRIRLASSQPPLPSASGITSQAAIEVEGVSHRYRGITALESVDLSIPAGRVTAVMGENGSGKTTLLRIIAGLARPTTGVVRINGVPVDRMSRDQRAQAIGHVPQNPSHVFLAESVEDEIRLALSVRPRPDLDATLEEFNLSSIRGRYPFDLSGGERQRLGLAIALAGDPKFAFLDEPTRGMDRRQMDSLARSLRARAARGMTIVIATHDVDLVAECDAHVILLRGGRVARTGDAADVFASEDALKTDVQRVFGDRYVLPEQAVQAMSCRAPDPGRSSAPR